MIKVDNKIKNIFIMLCYSFYGDKLNQKDENKLGAEAFENIYNLFSVLLWLMLSRQSKKGTYKEYIYTKEEISTVRGKINISETLSTGAIVRKKMVCEYDEFSENCQINQIIKTTIFYLLKSNKIGKTTKKKLKKLTVYFGNVDIIGINEIRWNTLVFNRNNISYKYIIDMCKLILKGLIVVDKKGENHFKEFLDDSKVSKIYENFVKAFFKRHYRELNANAKKLFFTQNNKSVEYLPIMKTDVTLEYNDKILIIDTKFYNKILKQDERFDTRCKVVSNGNVYQILAYVDNQDPYKENKAYGMLLYAQTVDEPKVMIKESLNGHPIIIRTLDLNDEWKNIEKEICSIADNFKEDNL